MPIIKNDNDEMVLYIHIPKTGGTSIENAIFSNYSYYFKTPKSAHMLLPVTAQHFDKELYIHYGIERVFNYSFSVVRNPLQRIISEYKHRCRNSRLISKLMTFDAFVMYVIKEYKTNNYIFDNHIKPQSKFIFDDTKVFKLEDGMEAITNELAERGFEKIGIIGNDNASEKSSRSIQYSNYTLKSVYRFYSEDYALFGYKPPIGCQSTTLKDIWVYFSSIVRLATYRVLRKIY